MGSRSAIVAGGRKDALSGDIARLETALATAVSKDMLAKGSRETAQKHAAMSRMQARYAPGGKQEHREMSDRELEVQEARRETSEVMVGHGLPARRTGPSLEARDPSLDSLAGAGEVRAARALRASGEGGAALTSQVAQERLRLRLDFERKETAMRRMYLRQDSELRAQEANFAAAPAEARRGHAARLAGGRAIAAHEGEVVEGGSNQQLRVYPYSATERAAYDAGRDYDAARDRAVDGPLRTGTASQLAVSATATWPLRPTRSPLEQGAYKDRTIYDGDYNWPSLSEVTRGDEWKQSANCGLWGGNC